MVIKYLRATLPAENFYWDFKFYSAQCTTPYKSFGVKRLITIAPLFHLHISPCCISGQAEHYHTCGIVTEDYLWLTPGFNVLLAVHYCDLIP
jgi:hypothetical protein